MPALGFSGASKDGAEGIRTPDPLVANRREGVIQTGNPPNF